MGIWSHALSTVVNALRIWIKHGADERTITSASAMGHLKNGLQLSSMSNKLAIPDNIGQLEFLRCARVSLKINECVSFGLYDELLDAIS